jgi:hypothetical protein
MVEDGMVINVTKEDGEEVAVWNTLTIESLFKVIQNSIACGAEEIDVTYNADLGYPMDIMIDPIDGLANDKTNVQVQNFMHSPFEGPDPTPVPDYPDMTPVPAPEDTPAPEATSSTPAPQAIPVDPTPQDELDAARAKCDGKSVDYYHYKYLQASLLSQIYLMASLSNLSDGGTRWHHHWCQLQG